MQKRTELTENPVFKESITTEKTYMTSLQILSAALDRQLTLGEDPFFGQLKAHIEQFVEISDGLLSNVTESLENIENTELRKELQNQRIAQLKRFFKILSSYNKLHHEYTALCKAKPKHFEPINSFLSKDGESNSKGLTFDALVILPIQRGPRYFLLLHEIMKHNLGCDGFNVEEFTQLEELFKDCLSEFSTKLPLKPPYKFGDFSRSLFGFMRDVTQGPVEIGSETKAQGHATPAVHQGYRFGDITRKWIWGANTNYEAQTTSVDSSANTASTKSENAPVTYTEEKPVVLHLSLKTLPPVRPTTIVASSSTTPQDTPLVAERSVVQHRRQSLASLPPGYQLGALMKQSLLKPNTSKVQGQTSPVVSSVAKSFVTK